MKNILLISIFMFGFLQGATKKVSELDSLPEANIAVDDVLAVVDTSAGETKKISFGELDLRWLGLSFPAATVTTGVLLEDESYLEFQESSVSGDNYIRLKSPSTLGSNFSYTLPNSYGTDGQKLETDGAGGLEWADAGAGSDVGRYCSWKWDYASNSFWQTTSTTVGDFSADTDFDDPDITTTSIATAAGVTCSAPGTKIPSAITANLPAGEYQLSSAIFVYTGNATSCVLRVTDGTTHGSLSWFGHAADDRGTITPKVNIIYGSTSSPTFKIQGASAQSGIPCSIGAGVTHAEITLYLDRIR